MKVHPWHLALIATVAIIGMTALATGGTQPGAAKAEGTTIQDITVEGASITIPAPTTGTYELVCAEGYADATLVVE